MHYTGYAINRGRNERSAGHVALASRAVDESRHAYHDGFSISAS